MKKTDVGILRDLKRRDFLRVGSLSYLGIGLEQFLQMRGASAASSGQPAKSPRAQACILLWLEGGPSQVDTWDPKPNSSFRPIPTNVPGIQVSELLPGVARHMDKLSIIRSMRSEEIDHAHAWHYAMTGHRPTPAMEFPSLGSIISKELGSRNSLPPHVFEPQHESNRQFEDYFKAAFLGAMYNPMVVPDPSRKNFKIADLSLPKSMSSEQIENRSAILRVVDHVHRTAAENDEYSELDTFRKQALEMILSPTVKRAFDLSQESEKTKSAYGAHRFGQSVLLARRLVESGCRFVTAAGYSFGGWDTHAQNDTNLKDTLAPPLDQALSALLEDLYQRGLLDSTIVIAMGEFGRTPHINPNAGRDHWVNCWSLAIGGGGLHTGQVIGRSDGRAAEVADRMVTIGDLYATIYKAMGIDWEKTYMSPIGRPVNIANSIGDKPGAPINELIL
jgi:hypothetical protein